MLSLYLYDLLLSARMILSLQNVFVIAEFVYLASYLASSFLSSLDDKIKAM